MLFSLMFSSHFLGNQTLQQIQRYFKLWNFPAILKATFLWNKQKLLKQIKTPFQFLNPKILSLLFVKLLSLSFLCKPLICFHSHHQSPKNLSSLLRSTSSKSTSLTSSWSSICHHNRPLTHKSPNPVTPKSTVATTMSYHAKAHANIAFFIPSISTTKSIILCFA